MTVEPIAVVTGASSGIGYATALHLARSGWQVLAGMRDLTKAPRLEAAATGLSLSVVEIDITSDCSVQAAFELINARGPVQALINNAGVSGGAPFELTTDDENRLMFETNYFARCAAYERCSPGCEPARAV